MILIKTILLKKILMKKMKCRRVEYNADFKPIMKYNLHNSCIKVNF